MSSSTWDARLFAELQHLLGRVVAQPTTSSLRRLFLKLQEARPWLENLTAVPGPSDADQRTAENVTPSGTSQKVDAEVTKAVSTALSISQVLAATLALQAEERRARYPSRTTLEISVYTFHEWCSQMLDFVSELLRLTIGADAEPGQAFDSLREWVADLLSTSMADRILSQLDAHQSRIAHSSSDFMLTALRSEQVKLSTILVRIAQGGFLGRGLLIKTVKWLKKADRIDPVVALVYGAYLSVVRPMDSLDEDDPLYSVSLTPRKRSLMQNLDDWSHDVKFLRLSASLVAQEQWTIPQLREAARLPYCLFYGNAARYENATAEVGFDAEHNMTEAINSGALRAVLDLVQLVDFINEPARELVDALAQRKNFVRGLRNREEDSRRGQTAHFQEFLALGAALYTRLPSDSAEHLWSDLPFASAILDSRQNSPALFAFLCAIARGPTCATRCFERLKDTRLQWQSLFRFYQHYFDIMPRLFEPMRSTRAQSLDPMALEEAQICKGWTELLTIVVQDSAIARNALLQAKPLQHIFDFINCDIPLELKASVLDAATAFLPEGAGAAVEHYERVSFADPTVETSVPPIGWVAKMELQEQYRSTALTTAYVRFLTALLPLKEPRALRALRRGAIYILDRVLPRPELSDVALEFVERAIFRLDLSQLESATARSAAKSISESAGYLVLHRFLNEPFIFQNAAQALDRGTITLLVLRMYDKILSTQLLFSDILLPLLGKSTATFSLDHYLLGHLPNIEALALLVGSEDLQIAHLAIQILRRLAQSPVFSRSDTFRGYPSALNRLAGIIDASDSSILIAQAFCTQLDLDATSDDTDDEVTPYTVRSAIMDLLIEGTSDVGPSLAHFLLGFDFKAADFGLQDPRSPSSRLSCLHIIIRQLADDQFFDIHPKLAARGSQLIYQLFAHPTTGRTTMTYVAAIADLLPRQLEALPLEAADTLTLLEYQRWVLAGASLSIYARVIEADELFGDHPLLLALLDNVALTYPQSTESRPLEQYASFDFDRFKRADADWWDLERLRAALGEPASEEAQYIVARLASINAATELSLAKGAFLTTWCDLLKIALATYIRKMPQVRQEVVLYSLLDALFHHLSSDLTPGIAEILCESVLITMSVLVTLDNDTSPDQIAHVLHHLVDAALLPGLNESCRGNIYAAISQQLQMIDNAVTSDDVATLSPQDVRRVALGVLSARKDRFLLSLCRDALDDRDVWKTECFALLGGIVSLCHTERDRQLLQPIQSSLPAFIRSIKDRDVALQSGQDQHAFWVYEANVAFLTTLASSQMGAQWLLDAGVFEIFATCNFLAIQPSDPSSASEEVANAHRVFVGALQLLSRALSSLQGTSRTGAGHALSFLNAHRETLLLILRESEDDIGMLECRLIISILSMVVHKVPTDDLRSPSGFGAFQHGVLALATHHMAETEESDRYFDAQDVALSQAILGFLCQTTIGLKGGAGQPVFLLGTQRSDATKYLASAPTLLSAIRYLSDLSNIDDMDALRKGTIESLLLLIWRHMLFYGSDPRDPIRPDALSFSSSRSSGLGEVARELHQATTDLDLGEDAYGGMMVRRLQELAGGIAAAGMT